MQRRRGEVADAVLFDILIRLPAKSLCRFRSVSTTWRSLMSDPYFIRSHYALSETRRKLLLQMGSGRSKSLWELLVSDEDHPEPPAATVKLLNRSPKACDLTMRSVHGLILHHVRDDCIDIMNPSTQESISISPPHLLGISSRYNQSDCQDYYCFGFDPVADKHKVLYTFPTFDSSTRAKVVQHWVFTLGGAEKWRRIGGLNSHHIKRSGQGEVCINGVAHFLAFNFDSQIDYLVAFDLKSEIFQTVKLSLPGTRPLQSYMLIEFNGSVALAWRYLVNSSYNCPSGIHLLVLEDFHKQVWKLERSVATPDLWLDVIHDQKIYLRGAPRSGNLLVFMPCMEREPGLSYSLYFYEVRSNRFWSSEIRAPEGDEFAHSYLAEVCDHVESVVPLTGSSDRL